MNTDVVLNDGRLLYSTLESGEEEEEHLRTRAVSYMAPAKDRKKSGDDILGLRYRQSWDQGHIFDDMWRIEKYIRALSDMTGLVIAMTILIILAASFLFSRNIVRPVAKLHKNLERIRDGDYSVRVAVESNDELGDLCDAFNGMAGEIDRL